MHFCATCPAFEAPKPMPEAAAALGMHPDAGTCRLDPTPVRKTVADWCMRHPGLRYQMAMPDRLMNPGGHHT